MEGDADFDFALKLYKQLQENDERNLINVIHKVSKDIQTKIDDIQTKIDDIQKKIEINIIESYIKSEKKKIDAALSIKAGFGKCKICDKRLIHNLNKIKKCGHIFHRECIEYCNEIVGCDCHATGALSECEKCKGLGEYCRLICPVCNSVSIGHDDVYIS